MDNFGFSGVCFYLSFKFFSYAKENKNMIEA